MNAPTFDLTPFLGRDEGQHFDRKSMFEGEEGKKRPRDRRKVRDQVAEQVAGFANAEGGVLILGIEDDVTGHQLPPDALAALLDVPRVRLHPPQPQGFVLQHDGHSLIVFDVPNCDVPVRVEGDGFPLRIGDKTMQVSESHIQKLKFRGLVESWESRPSHLRLADLAPALLERARRGAGLIALTDEEYLLKRKLADHRGRDLVLRQAAELLFAKNGPDHPNAGFRLFRVVGAERKVGAEHNVEERPRFEGSLPTVIEECFAAIEGILRRPARLVGHRFRTVTEYPEFSWKEAIVNAAAHRDYNVEGRTTEIWFFDDRLEVVSPGGLLPDVNLEELLALHRIHVSRNPRTVRVLVDLGIVRDQGEGIPRMFAEMEGFFLPAPVLDPQGHLFRVTLRNTATLTADDKSFVARLGDAELSDVEFRALLEAHRRPPRQRPPARHLGPRHAWGERAPAQAARPRAARPARGRAEQLLRARAEGAAPGRCAGAGVGYAGAPSRRYAGVEPGCTGVGPGCRGARPTYAGVDTGRHRPDHRAARRPPGRAHVARLQARGASTPQDAPGALRTALVDPAGVGRGFGAEGRPQPFTQAPLAARRRGQARAPLP
jgi:ATP-dependent DNA helicase RecG